jgi:hypothetical protein
MNMAATAYEGRRAQRDLVSFRAPIDGPGGMRTSLFMVDISPLGFMSRTSAPLGAGDLVAVKLPVVGPRAARIVWSLGGRVGGEFVDPIPTALYGRLLASAPNDRPNLSEC